MGSMLGKGLGAEICRIQPREEDEARKAVGMTGLEEGEPVAEGPRPPPPCQKPVQKEDHLGHHRGPPSPSAPSPQHADP